MLRRQNPRHPLTQGELESIIRQVHYLVLADKMEDRAVYRRVPVRIMGVKHDPVQPYLLAPEMKKLMADYSASIEHIVPILARFHIDFESIHPFIDGNSRTGRLLVNFELMKTDSLPVILNLLIDLTAIRLLTSTMKNRALRQCLLYFQQLTEQQYPCVSLPYPGCPIDSKVFYGYYPSNYLLKTFPWGKWWR